MAHRQAHFLLATVMLAIFVATLPRSDPDLPDSPSTFRTAGISASLPSLPLSFEPVRFPRLRSGQASSRLLARTVGGPQLLLSATEAVSPGFRMRVVGAAPDAAGAALKPLPGRVHRLIGRDPSRWERNRPTCGAVRYRGVYPGIDLVYRGSEGRLEYDFVVAPGADPGSIRLEFPDADRLTVTPDGGLSIRTGEEEVVQRKPRCYQEIGGERRTVAGGYRVTGKEARFAVEPYDAARSLVIDPVVVFATYLGGSDYDQVAGIAVDPQGNLLVAGFTVSASYPTTPGAYQTNHRGDHDGFVAKLSADGSTLLFCTYLGGSGHDFITGIALDSLGRICLGGETQSGDFPTFNAFQDQYAGGYGEGGGGDGWIARLSSDGSTLLSSTYLGGSADERQGGFAVDGSDNLYVSGWTYSDDFPVTPNAFQRNLGGGRDAYVAKLTTDGHSLAYATYLGGGGDDRGHVLTVDAQGHAYLSGMIGSGDFPVTPGAFQTQHGGDFDATVTKLSLDGSGLLYSTFLGGWSEDTPYGLAVDADGNAYVCGHAQSPNFPVKNALYPIYRGGFRDAFVTKVNPSGTDLVFSTFVGAGNWDDGNAIVLDKARNVWFTGYTFSRDFPVTGDAFQPIYGGGERDCYIAKLSADGASLLFSSYLGGTGMDTPYALALDAPGNLYVAGHLLGGGFPVTPGAFQTVPGGTLSNFLVKIGMTAVIPDRFDYHVPGQPQSTLTLRQGNPPILTFHLVGANGYVRDGVTPVPSLKGCGTLLKVEMVTIPNPNVKPLPRVKVTATNGTYLSQDGFVYAKPTTYTYDFAGVVGREWSHTTVSTTPSGRRFLGRFTNDVVTLTLDGLPAHTKAVVAFDLFIIESWDGNGVPPNCCGPDVWDLRVAGGPTLLHTTFNNVGFGNQSYPAPYPGGNNPPRMGATENNTLGYRPGHYGDSVYHLSYTFGHTGGMLGLRFVGINLQEMNDESWGIDNIRVDFQ